MLLRNDEVSGKVGGATGSDTSHPACVVRGSDCIDNEADIAAEDVGSAYSTREGRIRACVHEVGHNLAMNHHDGLKYEIQLIDEIRSTPMGCPDGENNCGKSCVTADATQWLHLWSDCAIQSADEL